MDQPREGRHPLEPGAQERDLPRELDMRARTWNEDDVEMTLPGDAVGDADVTTPGVAGLGDHPESFAPPARSCQTKRDDRPGRRDPDRRGSIPRERRSPGRSGLRRPPQDL